MLLTYVNKCVIIYYSNINFLGGYMEIINYIFHTEDGNVKIADRQVLYIEKGKFIRIKLEEIGKIEKNIEKMKKTDKLERLKILDKSNIKIEFKDNLSEKKWNEFINNQDEKTVMYATRLAKILQKFYFADKNITESDLDASFEMCNISDDKNIKMTKEYKDSLEILNKVWKYSFLLESVNRQNDDSQKER